MGSKRNILRIFGKGLRSAIIIGSAIVAYKMIINAQDVFGPSSRFLMLILHIRYRNRNNTGNA